MRRFTLLPRASALSELQQYFFCTRQSFHSLSRVKARKLRVEQALAATKAMDEGYAQWSQQQLIARIQELEGQLGGRKEGRQTTTTLQSTQQDALQDALQDTLPDTLQDSKPQPYRKPPKAPPKAFDASKYSTRLIALKFAYLGQQYNGFEHHNNNKTPLPTIEEVLWKALIKTRLISPTAPAGASIDYTRDGADVNWEGCEYSKCGRTDRGVSAFGQVIGIRVRSNRRESSEAAFDDLNDELPYIQLLNRVLPPDIRVYAWCPNPPANFSARFSCKERRYKYFFTNPCFAPVPGASGLYNASSSSSSSSSTPDPTREGWLDIAAMQDGCDRLVGLHDFRNMCKIDASKQLTNFKRRIFHASIDVVSPLAVPAFLHHPALANPSSPDAPPAMYCFTLHGSAFLWHQVRTIIAVLFLLGQRLEHPQLVSDLLDISKNPTRPKYEMASDAPLVLWDCIFPHAHEVQSAEERHHGYEDRLQWVYVGDAGGVEAKSKANSLGRGKWARGGVLDDVWEVWRGDKMNETLSGLLMERIAGLGASTLDEEAARQGDGGGSASMKTTPRVFDGGNVGKAKGSYVPVLQRERQETVEVVNERYAKKKGLDPARYQRDEDDGGD